MATWRLRALLVTASALLGAALSTPAQAYEFEARARTIGQGSSLQMLRLSGPSVYLSRRRVSQSLQLHIWDIAGTRRGFRMFSQEPVRGPQIYFNSYLRLDHDFGTFTSAPILVDGVLSDALDRIPELSRSALELDMLYGFLAAEGLWEGRLDLYAGRLMEVQTLDWFSMDGFKGRVHLGRRLWVEGFGGLRVRESSWLGSEVMAPDGTSGALCEEYVEGPLPGSGAWRPIDGLPALRRSPFTSDDERCPQRQQLMPTFGAAVGIDGLGPVSGRLSYRRSQSRSPGVLGAVDRLDYPDLGFYPSESGQAQGWGVNEERVALSLRAPMKLGGQQRLTPYVAARYSVLHGLFDEAHAGARYARGAHSVESELFYSMPTFDGDSIFNIFSSEPYSDLRSTWEYSPKEARWGGYLRGWGRRYHTEDREEAAMPEEVDTNRYASGLHAGARYRPSRATGARLDAFYEDGYGGLRAGSNLWGEWRMARDTLLSTRLSVVRFEEDLRKELHGYNLGAQVRATYLINKGFTTTLLVEENSNRFDRFQFGAFVIVDLAFQPET